MTLGATEPGHGRGRPRQHRVAGSSPRRPPGTVLVGEATERAASRAIAFEPAGDQALKGKAAPVPAWRALRVVAERRRPQPLGHASRRPFVGRDDELRLLKDLFHATGARAPRPPRLRHRARPASARPASRGSSPSTSTGSSSRSAGTRAARPAYGEGISFWALGEMVRAPRRPARDRRRGDDPRPRSPRRVAEHVPDEAERRWIEPALLTLLGLDGGRRRSRAAVRRLAHVLRADGRVGARS